MDCHWPPIALVSRLLYSRLRNDWVVAQGLASATPSLSFVHIYCGQFSTGQPRGSSQLAEWSRWSKRSQALQVGQAHKIDLIEEELFDKFRISDQSEHSEVVGLRS